MDFLTDTLQTRRERDGIFKVLKENTANQEYLTPANVSFRNEEEIRTFQNKPKMREFITTRST